MADLKEQRVSIKLPFKWGKMLYKLFLKAAGGQWEEHSILSGFPSLNLIRSLLKILNF
jgi:hypothetical protein